jgi:hypothetical protein
LKVEGACWRQRYASEPKYLSRWSIGVDRAEIKRVSKYLIEEVKVGRTCQSGWKCQNVFQVDEASDAVACIGGAQRQTELLELIEPEVSTKYQRQSKQSELDKSAACRI